LVEGRPEVPILATASVAKVIGDSDAAKEKQWRPVFGDEWPVKRAFPTRIVRDGETVVFDGLSFSVHELGPGESHADTYWVLDSDARDVFLGDEVFQGMHSYLADGHSTAWLANLDRLERALGGIRTIYPGHGEPGGLGLIVDQRAYLEAYRAEVRAHLAPGAKVLAPEEKKAFVAGMLARYPAARVTFLVELGADPVAAELSGER
jgi:glyoxylase-like metal-dependent hydrolase (beta-lactamase superfamily II)